MPFIEVTVSTDKVGSKCTRSVEISREDLDSMSEADIEEVALETMWELINMDFDVIEDARDLD